MENFKVLLSAIARRQSGLVQSYLNYLRTLGDMVSDASYKSRYAEMYKSTADTLKYIPLTNPFVAGKTFSSLMVEEWFSRIKLNIDFLGFANSTCKATVNTLNAQYNNLIDQVKDNFTKLQGASSSLMSVPVSIGIDVPLLYKQTIEGSNIEAEYVKSYDRSGTSSVFSDSSDSVFPVTVISKNNRKLMNWSSGFSVTMTPESPLYGVLLRYNDIDVVESFNYFLELKKEDDSIVYRTSADKDLYSPWTTIKDIDEFFPILNDFNEPIGLDIKLTYLREGHPIKPEWFTTTQKHSISISLSKDYGMIKPLVFALTRPTTINNITFYNYGSSPFIVDRIDGSLDNVKFYTVYEDRDTVFESTRLAMNLVLPVKYLRVYFKQETYRIDYDAVQSPEAILNNISMLSKDPSVSEWMSQHKYDMGWLTLKNKIFRDEIKALKLSRNWSDTTTEKVYVYELKVGDIKINGLNLIEYLV